MTQPAGVFVRLPLSEGARELLVEAAAFGKSDDSHDRAILSIGSPVTGSSLIPVGEVAGHFSDGQPMVRILNHPNLPCQTEIAIYSEAQAVIAALEGKVGRLREIIKESRNAIMSDINEHSIVCTVWVRPGETLIDYIDDALEGDAP